jgi:hypothetical protein
MNNVQRSNFLDTIRYEYSIIGCIQDEDGYFISLSGKQHVIQKLHFKLNNCDYCGLPCCENVKDRVHMSVDNYIHKFCLTYNEICPLEQKSIDLRRINFIKKHKKEHNIITDSGWWIKSQGLRRRQQKKYEIFEFFDGDFHCMIPDWFWL